MLRMGDSIDPGAIPAGLDAYAGYVGGRWPDFWAIAAAHPGTHVLSIAISANEDADCLDIETGDATIAQAPSWAARQRARGVARPALYISAAAAGELWAVMAAAGWARPAWRLLTAHYDQALGRHICGSCQYPAADGTQWVDHGGWDESLLADDFFPAVPAAPTTQEVAAMASEFIASDGQSEFLITEDRHSIELTSPADGSALAKQLGITSVVSLSPAQLAKFPPRT